MKKKIVFSAIILSFFFFVSSQVYAQSSYSSLNEIGKQLEQAYQQLQTLTQNLTGKLTAATAGYNTPTVDLKANTFDGPITVSSGSNVILYWVATNTDSCTISGPNLRTFLEGDSSMPFSGSVNSGFLTMNTTFTITCTGPGGTASDSVTINVLTISPPIISDLKVNYSTSPVTVASGSSVSISYVARKADSCNVSGPLAWKYSVKTSEPYPSTEVYIQGWAGSTALTANTTFTITCTGPGGTSSASVTVYVAKGVPSVTISANPTTVITGQSSILSWSSTNATSCTAGGGWSGLKLTSGSQVVAPTQRTTYTLTCWGPGGNISGSVIIDTTLNKTLIR